MKLDCRALPGEGGVLLWPAPEDVPDGFRIVFATRVFLSPRGLGFVNYGFTGIPGSDAAKRNLCRILGLNFEKLTLCRQTHSADVALVDETSAGTGRGDADSIAITADALATDIEGVPLAVTTADCVPILIADPAARAAAAVHAGWRGTASGIVGNAVAAMRNNFRSEPRAMRAYLGPSIGPCCYEIGDELAAGLAKEDKEYIIERDGGRFLDLRAWNAARLRSAGLNPANIHAADACTKCRADLFFSYRGDKERMGSNISIIAMDK